MSIYYCQLTYFLHIMFENENNAVQKFMVGEQLPFCETTYIKKDCIHSFLLAENDKYDNNVATMLPTIFKGMLGVAKNMYRDHLLGGKFHTLNITQEMIGKTKRGFKTQCVCRKCIWVS